MYRQAERHDAHTGSGDVVVEDVKTKSTRALDVIVRQGPSQAEWFQVHLYAHLLRIGGLKDHPGLPTGEPLPVDVVRLRYVGREYGQVVVHQRAYDEDVTKQALAWAEDVLASTEPEAMPRDLDGPGLSIICDNCPFRTACWNLDQLSDDRAPQTILAEDTAAITEALRAYADAAEVESAAREAQGQGPQDAGRRRPRHIRLLQALLVRRQSAAARARPRCDDPRPRGPRHRRPAAARRADLAHHQRLPPS